MELLDLNKTIKNQKIAAGVVVILQGGCQKTLTILHSGLAELLSNKDEFLPASAEGIIQGSIRVGLIKGESVCGIMGLSNFEPYSRSIRTLTDCVISSMPIEEDKILTALQSNISLNLQVLRALVQRIESASFLFNNYKYLWHKLASIQDSLASARLKSDNPVGPNGDRYFAGIAEYSVFLKIKLAEANHPAPENWDHNVFLGRLHENLGLYEEEDKINIESIIDNQQFLFIKRILRKSDTLLAELFKKDEPTNYYIFQFLSQALEGALIANESKVRSINALIDILFTDNGWIDTVLQVDGLNDKKQEVYNYYLAKFSWRCKNDIQKLLGKDLEKEYSVYLKLGKYERSAVLDEMMEDKKSGERSPEVKGNRLSKYKNLTKRILEFSDIPHNDKNELYSLLTAFKDLPKKFESDPKLNKIKSEFNPLYWRLYENCFLKIIDSDLKSFVPGIMLHFGLLDERLMSDSDLTCIDEAYSGNLNVEKPIPVMTMPYFLEKIYRAQTQPSLSEMGQTFREILKRQKNMTKKEAAEATIYSDVAEDRVRYEIRNISSYAAPLLYGSRKKAFAPICGEAVIGALDRQTQVPEEFSKLVDSFRERDFSLFYRDIVFHHKNGSDIIKKEVAPNFILYPVVGSRMMMWQELDGPKRETQGRIFVPLVFNEKIEESTITALAHFRWELQKTMAGAKWMDSVEGGLVGAYFDYINYFRKNTHLSPAAKEQLIEFVKKTRSDKERFALDYLSWVKFEYEGRMKLNPQAREIFYRYCPFAKNIRSEMARRPVFGNLEMKYQNRASSAILKAESRKIKYEKSGEKVPPELIDYLEFLKR